MADYTVTVSGHAVVPAWGGPDNFWNVDGRGGANQQGFGENEGKRFRKGAAGVTVFFAPRTTGLLTDMITIAGPRGFHALLRCRNRRPGEVP